MILFDTSAVIERLREGTVIEGYVLDLTYYELANAMRTAVQVKKYLQPEDARTVLKAFEAQPVQTIRAEIEDVGRIEELAERLNITAHDAAYIYFAEKHGLELVTADRRLERAWKAEKDRRKRRA